MPTKIHRSQPTSLRPPYSELDDPWKVDLEDGLYQSKYHEGQRDQRIVFDQPFRDGAVTATALIRRSVKVESEGKPEAGKTAAIIVRYQDRYNHYFAGVAGFGKRFFIAMRKSGEPMFVEGVGSSASIGEKQEFRLRVECVGDRITLEHNGIRQVSLRDSTFQAGPWGFHTWLSEVEFRDVGVRAVRPNCFVIMPFASEFTDVYSVIKETVENHGFECVRADERYTSGTIMNDVAERIEQADLIVADFTNRNPNVFYEVGYAAALGKPVIQIAQSVSDLPFDVRHLRVFSYDTQYLGDRKLAYNLSAAIKATTGFGEIVASEASYSV